ncbi:MAG: glycosyltransferase [Gemmatimonadetes bacterium]|nr:glycosyltransferase [Gemmatimonadota bacterium]
MGRLRRTRLSAHDLHLLVPGSIDQLTGGYIYDKRVATGLERLGWRVVVHSLDGAFPTGGARAEASLSSALAELPAGTRVLVDGLAMGAHPGPMLAHRERLRLLALVHLPLADDFSLDASERIRLLDLERKALAACVGVIVASEFTAARMEAYDVPRFRVRTVPPGSDPAPLAHGPGSGDPPRLLCVGSVVPGKGQDVLVRALTRIRHLRWSCTCVGSLTRAPSFVRAVLGLVEEGGLSDRMDFPGECDRHQLDEMYDAASLFVFPSHYEGYGMALAEALVYGLPVVSTSGGAIPHTVPADAGVFVTPGDDRGLAEALEPLLSDVEGAARRAKLASAARKHGLTLPDWNQAVAVCAEAILELTPDG